MTVEDCKKVLELIDKNTKWFNDGFNGEHNCPELHKKEIEQLKKDVKGLITFEGESNHDQGRA